MKLRIATKADQVLLERLQQFYLHDLSEYAQSTFENGQFVNDDIEKYIKEPMLTAYLIIESDEVIGFILFNQAPYVPTDHDYFINDFFILKPFRRKGYGLKAFEYLIDIYPGVYGLLELKTNRSAIQFWRIALKRFRQKEIEMVVDNAPCLLISCDLRKQDH
jgi:predicted acetyltransferase